jgi:hypothetical protein
VQAIAGRTTKAEVELVERLWALQAGDQPPLVRHYLPANRRSTPLGFGLFRKVLENRPPMSSPLTAESQPENTVNPGQDRSRGCEASRKSYWVLCALLKLSQELSAIKLSENPFLQLLWYFSLVSKCV